MSFVIRPITAAEIEPAEQIVAVAFNNRRPLAEVVAEAQRKFDPKWYLAAFDEGEMTTMMKIIPNRMQINGGSLSFGAVSPVASSPFHRRKGHTDALLRASLRRMREQGQVISGLY